MRVLVTGATGFIGQNLIAHLLEQEQITLILLLREQYSQGRGLPATLAPLRPQFEVVYADLRNLPLTLRAVQMAEPDAVLHLAAVGATDPFLNVQTALRHNLDGMLNLLQACFAQTQTTRQVVVARTPGEKQAMNVYAASKAAAWKFCQMYGRTHQWPIHGAMIYQCYGPGQPAHALIPAAMRAALAGTDFPMTVGTQERDWVYVSDVARGLTAMLHSRETAGKMLPPGTTIDLGTGHLTSVANVVRQIYNRVALGGRPLIGVLPSRPGEDPLQVADTAETRRLLGWETAVSLSDGLWRYQQALQPAMTL